MCVDCFIKSSCLIGRVRTGNIPWQPRDTLYARENREILPAVAAAVAVPAESRRASVFCWRPHSRCSRCRSIYTCCRAPGAASAWPLAVHSCTWPVDWCSYEDRLSRWSACSFSLGSSWSEQRSSPICRHRGLVPVPGVARRTAGPWKFHKPRLLLLLSHSDLIRFSIVCIIFTSEIIRGSLKGSRILKRLLFLVVWVFLGWMVSKVFEFWIACNF